MRRFLACCALPVLISVGPLGAATVPSAGDLLDSASADGRFTVLLQAAQVAGLLETFQAPGPLTLFAPTDEAFARLPAETLASILEPQNREQLRRMLSFHMVDGRVLSTDLLRTASTTTLSGLPVSFGLRVGEANVIAPDLLCSNGVMHVLDRVLLPPQADPWPAHATADALRSAIARGAPLFNAGDPQGCVAVYEATARQLLAQSQALGELAAQELARLLPTGENSDSAARAWELRRAFDRILEDEAFQPRIEAPMPAGFPAPGPVGRVVVKHYPPYRAARATGGGAFWSLFGHIQENEVQMTAPVEMTMDSSLRELDMAFLYERPNQGSAGTQGNVSVIDLLPLEVLSIGMRGERNRGDLERAKAALETRLAKDGLLPAGPFRMLGYNSPMVPAAQRFWELQLPTRRNQP